MIKLGSRWRVGNGFYRDRWLPTPTSFIFSPKTLDEDIKVRSLMSDFGVWNESLIRDNFVPGEVDLILSIPLNSIPKEDSFLAL